MKNQTKIANFWELINDNQESIKFLESKIAFITVLIGAMIASIFERLDNIFENYIFFSILYKSSFILLIILILICIYLIFKIFYPQQNPIDSISEPYKSYKNLYLNKINEDDKLVITSHYEEIFKKTKTLAESLELEFLKLSYIRNYKNKLILILTKFLVATVILFITNICIEKYENNIICKKVGKSCCEK